MKYSIIICYRNRQSHLDILLPALKKKFEGEEYEIIISEQDNNFKFQRGQLFNVGALNASGKILIFHDVDHIPTENVKYWDDSAVDVWMPIKNVKFVNNDLLPKKTEDIPSGYRNFINDVGDDYFGGIISMTREFFFHINGYNSLYFGWGLEDQDLRERIKYYSGDIKRSAVGTFLALHHDDNFPGLEDMNFSRNTNIYNNWKSNLSSGVNDQYHITEKHSINDCVVLKNKVLLPMSQWKTINLQSVIDFYKDDPEIHRRIWSEFKYLTNQISELKSHRDWVVLNEWGYGNRSFHWMWNLIISTLKDDFKFLEIGVFKGQIISLISYLNYLYKKDGQIFGITPLNTTGDKYATHPDINYEEAIQRIYAQFNLSGNDLNIIEGLSTDKTSIDIAEQCGPYDVVYIDGGHDYETVINDINTYSKMISVKGFLIMDDASNDLKIPNGLIRLDWKGLPDVTKAVNDTLDTDVNFKLLFAVGHNKIYQRIN